MCNPVAGLAVASFVIGAGGQLARARAQNQASEANEKAALTAMHEAWTDIGGIQQEVTAQAGADIRTAQRTAAVAQSFERTGAGEAGVTGTSPGDVLDDFDRKALEYATQSNRNLDRKLQQLEREKISGRQVAQNRILSVPGANPFATALRIGAGAIPLIGARLNRGPA